MTNRSRQTRTRTIFIGICLGVTVALAGLLVAGLWAEQSSAMAAGQAEKPFLDSGTQVQLLQLVEAQRQTTAKVDELIRLFRSGKVIVIVESPTKEKGNDSTRRTHE